MKSVVQAAWLLTTALGDVIVVIIAGVKLFTQVSSPVCNVCNSSLVTFLLRSLITHNWSACDVRVLTFLKGELENEGSSNTTRK